ncbi:MAG: pilus assembly protein [Candidatus Ancillula sp.]|nr:pilus assembly protein [Candidatus Ancillula sp.]
MIKEQRGSVTAEYAICLPVVAFLIVLIVSLVSLSSTQTKCQNATSAVMRTAIELDDPTSDENLQTLHALAKTVVGEDYADDYKLDVVKDDENWVKIKMELPIHNKILKMMLKEVHAEAVGRLDI